MVQMTTKAHGVMDYAMGGLLMNALWLKFDKNSPETLVPATLGLGATAYSAFTNYEFGAVRKIPMKYHLMMDMASGALLALSPWIFGFHKKIWWPHVVAGITEIAAGIFTKRKPQDIKKGS